MTLSPRILTPLLALLLLAPAGARAQASDIRQSTKTVSLHSRSFRCTLVTIDLRSGRVTPRVVTARNGIGKTEEFEAMVKRSGALAAINGSFFDAYNAIGDKDPGMMLIRDGRVIHKGDMGTVIGFGPQGAIMGRLQMLIKGTVSRPGKNAGQWYAYWLNRIPTSPDSIILYTPAHGARVRFDDGLAVVVDRGQVVRIQNGDVGIPPSGFVLFFRGSLKNQASQFTIGADVRPQIVISADRDTEAWQAVLEALGAGPRLVTDGAITYNPESEGFQDPKILNNQGQRSAIGILKDGRVLLVSVGGPTVRELADIMKQLGAYQAMNLDGGASSGLCVNGAMLTRPGRQLSNILAFVRR